MLKRTFYMMIMLLLPACLFSCKDDFANEFAEIKEGKSEIEATLFFNRMTSASLGTASRAAGDAIKNIENLSVLVYSEDGQRLENSFYAVAGANGTFDYVSIDQTGNTDRPDDGNQSAETATPKAKVRFTVGNGKYKIYAVANMGNVAEMDVSTDEKLKTIKLTWQNEDKDTAGQYSVARNNQMFGYFSTDGSANGFDAEVVTVNRKVNLYCWLRRAASKITVAFDGTKLADNVHIYIKSVEIKDIPKECYLGRKNEVGKVVEGEEQPEVNSVLLQGEMFHYSDAEVTEYEKWPMITKMTKTLGLNQDGSIPGINERKEIKDYHTEYTPALYFYENIQGTGKDKRQDYKGGGDDGQSPDGILDHPGLGPDPEKYPDYIWKDDKTYGTYIEVKGFYERLSSTGEITYRFMLGKDILTDYNAERNYHYKLTLVFNGNANDADWHIEYEEIKDINVDNPYYISYLYHEDAQIPVELIGSGYENYRLKAEIIENDWFPYKEDPTDTYTYFDPEKVYNKGVWHGFLSLADTRNTPKIIPVDVNGKNIDGGNGFTDAGLATDDGVTHLKDFNKQYWNSEWRNEDHLAMGKRIYNLSVGPHSDKDGDYTVEKTANGILKVNIPYFTRAKQLLSSTGYTGNNPFVAYRRKAVVRLTVINKNDENPVPGIPFKDVDVFQVRRCVNPKGVWRSWNNTDQFHVVMKILKREDSEKFETYNSDGPWKAHVLVDTKSMIYLEGADEDGYVHGDHNTPMDFIIKFRGPAASEQDVRCAIVEVEYNNYTCKHKIFVRQGYAPVEMQMEEADGKTYTMKWHTCNMYTKNKETNSPLEEGSLFKFGNWEDAIDASNNKTYGRMQPIGKLKIAGGNTTKAWNEIQAKDRTGANKTIAFDDTEVDNVIGYSYKEGTKTKVKVAAAEEYQALIRASDREFGYGVLYGDGATETQETLSDVYEYTREDGLSSIKGMRGCFVYNKRTGNQLFFPIGSKGIGRRRTTKIWYGETAENKKAGAGALQYSWRIALYTAAGIERRPLFRDVYLFPGATYWCRQFKKNSDGVIIETNEDKAKTIFLDINYQTFDFNTGGKEPLDDNNNGTESSACFLRCVEEGK